MDSIMKKTAFIIGLISLLTACNSGSDDRFMELPDTPAGTGRSGLLIPVAPS